MIDIHQAFQKVAACRRTAVTPAQKSGVNQLQKLYNAELRRQNQVSEVGIKKDILYCVIIALAITVMLFMGYAPILW